MKTIKLIVLTIAISLNSVFAQENNVNDDTPKAYEMPRTQVIPINNPETKAQDTLYIKLPEGYEENNNIEYPVIYFTHPVQHIEALSAATEYIIEDVILVGITFQKGLTFGKVDSYLNFIRNDVFKTIESNYRADADRRTYFGYSAGALVGAYILSKHPNTFTNFILGSPALGVDPALTGKIYELESNAPEERKRLNANVFISYGTLEGEEGIKLFEKFIAMLKNLNDKSLTVQRVVIEGGNHQTAVPMTVVRSVTWLSDLIREDEFPRLEDPFFAQKPPASIPEIFDPRIVTIEHGELGAVFSPDVKEFYFRRYDEGLENDALAAIQYKDNLWTETFVVPRGEISPDGKVLYKGNEYREQTPSGWSAIKSLGAPFDSIPIMRLTASSKGTYYFDDVSHFNDKPPIVHIRYSRLIDGIHEKPRTLDFDTGTTLKFHPFIAPDESYLIFDSKPENGTADIYISFRQKDGSWGAAINLGDIINTERSEVYGSVTPDGKYFFFRRTLSNGKKNTMWVDTGFIEALRPK